MTTHELKLPENLDIHCRTEYASSTIKRSNGKVTSSINWSTIGSTDFETADIFAGSIIHLTETGNSIIAMIESGELKTVVETQMFVSPKSVFIPMEADERGVLGFDMQKDSVEYVTYGNLLTEYDDRQDITTERERNQEDYDKKLAKHRNNR